MKKSSFKLLIIFIVFCFGVFVLAGIITKPTSTPSVTMYTLEDIYKLIHNIPNAPSHTLSPTTSPNATSSYSISQIYADLANLVKRENLETGVSYLGVTGNYGVADPAYATTSIIASSLTASGGAGIPLGYSLEDVWNLVKNNATTSASTHTGIPSPTPASSMHSLEDIYNELLSLASTKISSIKAGVTYLGQVGTGCLSDANGFFAGDGTSGNPYQICSWTQLAHVNSHLTESFILNRDLLVADSDYSGLGNSWTPLGNYSNKFSGEFNGNDKIIHSPVVYLPTTNYVGFFGYSTGSLHNIILHDADITGKEQTGSLVGWQQGSVFSANSSVTASTTGTNTVGGLLGGFGVVTVSNSYSSGKVSGAGLYAGGLSGIAFTNIENSYSECTVNNTGLHTGGLVGYSWGEISDSYATGAVNSSSDNVGGLVGTLEGIVSNSYATGNTSGGNKVGGLLGYQKSGSISDSYATGDVGSFSSIGGLVGEQESGVTVSRSYATGHVSSVAISCGGLVGLSRGDISNSYATGAVTGEDAVGGLIGWKVAGLISNSFSVGSVSGSSDLGGMSGLVIGGSVSASFWDKQTSGRLTSGDSETGTSTLVMKTKTTFTNVGWDFDTIWDILSGYPFLR